MKIYSKLCLLLCGVMLLTAGAYAAADDMYFEPQAEIFEETAEVPEAVAYDEYPLTLGSSVSTPTVDKMIYSDDFSDGILDGRIEKTGGDGTLEETGGKLVLTRTSTAIRGDNISDGFNFYINSDKTPIYDYLTAVTFDMSLNASKEFVFEVLNDKDEAVTGLTVSAATGTINAQYKNESGISVDTVVYSGITAGSDIKATYAFNRITQTFSLWFNDEIVLENKGYKVQSDNLKYLTAALSRRNNAALSIDNLNIFNYNISDSDFIAYEKELLLFSNLTSESETEVTSNLNLYTEGKLGCEIAWQSSSEAVSADGTVTRSTENDINVTLTATITKGEVSDTKIFNIVIKKLEIKQQPEVKSVIFESAEEKVLSASPQTYNLGISSGKIIGYKFTVDSVGDYGFKMASESGEAALEMQKSGSALKIKAKDGSFVQIKNGAPKISEYTVLLDPMTNKYSMWLGLDKIVEMAEATGEAPAVVSVTFEQKAGTGTVSNFSAFNPIVPAEDAIVLDYEYLSFDTLTYQEQSAVTTDLRLKTEGRAGSGIVWTTTNSDIIAADGTVNSAVGGSASITAEISNGDYTKTKTFNVTVKQWEKSEKIEVKNMVFEEYFDDNEVNTTWTLSKNAGDILAENEGMIIKRQEDISGDGTETIADLYMNSASTIYKGIYALEFTLSRSAAKTVTIRQRGGGDYFAGQWNPDGTIQYFAGSTGKNTQEAFTNNSIKLTALFNTNNSTYSLFVDDKIIFKDNPGRASGNGIQYLRLYLQGNSLCDCKVDNIRFYEAYLLSEDRVAQDYNYLTEGILVDDSDGAYLYGMISKDLTLPEVGPYMSKITWSSSNESLISKDGKVSQSENDNEMVTLTATIESGGYKKIKEFTFKMLKKLESPSEAAQYDADCLSYESIASYDNGSSEIIRSLNLSDAAVYGSKITWKSSNTKYISNSGRVTRPRWDQEDAKVTMTATVTNAGSVVTKDFEFTVLKDEKWTDPQYMTDSEFFGVWNGEKWTTQGKLNYSYPGLETVGEAVKAGDINLAKERLQSYYATRTPKTTISKASRNTLWANALVDDFYHLQASVYFQGEMWVGNEWDSYESNITTSYVSPGSVVCYGVRAWYNEASYVDISRHDDENINYRPRIELTINGSVKTYYAIDDISVRAGDYKSVTYGGDDTLKVQTFGDFLANDTRQVVLKFDFSDLSDSDKITSAKLVLHAKTSPEYSGEKRLIVLKEPTNTWSGETAVWNDFPGYVYSYNGLPGKNDWVPKPAGADVEYWYQMCRFNGYQGAIGAEYLMSGDETYMYKMLSILNDYLHDTGNYKMTGTTSYNPNGIRGGFTRTLDACGKNGAFIGLIEVMAKSKTTTPEIFTAILKNIWDTTNYLSVYQSASGNWRQSEFQSILNSSIKMPEFTDALAGKNWRKMAQDELESMLFFNNLDDGSYVEATCGYNAGAFSGYQSYKSTMLENGVAVTEEYDELLLKCAYYNVMLYTPDGRNLQYGDDQAGKRSATPTSSYAQTAKWYGDRELEYIATLGASGTEPKWTSMHWPLSTVTIMRANWTTDSPFLFTNVRGGGQHGHRDFNGVIVSAYGRTLLNDAGIFTYTSSDPYRQWGLSTVAHNTVLANDTSQNFNSNAGRAATGTVHEWKTNRGFDYLSQSIPYSSDLEHRRTITFIKPSMWIVSDLMIPKNTSKENNYKQLWHMPPTAGIAVSEENSTIYSTYSTGANIIVANADGDAAELKTEMGYYDQSYQQLQEAPYAYFEKNAAGKATFDTVLMPSNNDPTAAVTAEKLETSENATALKIKFTSNGSDYEGYYYMTYDGSEGQFGKYTTDAQTAFVQVNAQGKVTYVMLKDGTYIKDDSGNYLIKSENKVDEISANMTGMSIYVITGEETDLSTVQILTSGVAKVFLNDEEVPYTVKDGVLSEIGTGSTTGNDEKVPSGGIKDPSNQGGSQGGNQGGSQGGNQGGSQGGNQGGSQGGNQGGSQGGQIDTEGFADVKGHWSEEYANDLKKKGIVEGDANGRFNPDNNITRAELTAMAVRSMGFEMSQYKGGFKDVSEADWYADVIQTALDTGLISGDEQFRPNDNITRQEMAKVLSEAAKISKKFEDTEIMISNFNDNSEIADWARDYVDYITSIGLMQGAEGNNFKPLSNATRGEAAAVISRLLK